MTGWALLKGMLFVMAWTLLLYMAFEYQSYVCKNKWGDAGRYVGFGVGCMVDVNGTLVPEGNVRFDR